MAKAAKLGTHIISFEKYKHLVKWADMPVLSKDMVLFTMKTRYTSMKMQKQLVVQNVYLFMAMWSLEKDPSSLSLSLPIGKMKMTVVFI